MSNSIPVILSRETTLARRGATYCRGAVKSGLTFHGLSRTKPANISFFLFRLNNDCP